MPKRKLVTTTTTTTATTPSSYTMTGPYFNPPTTRILPPFTRRVLALCKHIPIHTVATYKTMALALGDIKYTRAVGNALRNNPYAPRVPCHRIIASDCTLGGFGGKTDVDSENIRQKIRMLRSEGVIVHQLGNVFKVDQKSVVDPARLARIAQELTVADGSDDLLTLHDAVNDYTETEVFNDEKWPKVNLPQIDKFLSQRTTAASAIVVE